jgi:hypothetical protein
VRSSQRFATFASCRLVGDCAARTDLSRGDSTHHPYRINHRGLILDRVEMLNIEVTSGELSNTARSPATTRGMVSLSGAAQRLNSPSSMRFGRPAPQIVVGQLKQER